MTDNIVSGCIGIIYLDIVKNELSGPFHKNINFIVGWASFPPL